MLILITDFIVRSSGPAISRSAPRNTSASCDIISARQARDIRTRFTRRSCLRRCDDGRSGFDAAGVVVISDAFRSAELALATGKSSPAIGAQRRDDASDRTAGLPSSRIAPASRFGAHTNSQPWVPARDRDPTGATTSAAGSRHKADVIAR
jgi:hypothetical protein